MWVSVPQLFHYFCLNFAEWTTDQRRQSVRYWIVLDELVPSPLRRPPLKSFRPPPCLKRLRPLSPPSTSPARLLTSTLRQASGAVLWNRNYFLRFRFRKNNVEKILPFCIVRFFTKKKFISFIKFIVKCE